jgi:hypothetical protein
MKSMPLNLQDLTPKETTFVLSDFPNEKFTLCRFTLRVRAWVLERYTSKELQGIFEDQKINDIALISYFMLKEKEKFPTLDSFLDAIVTIQDQISVMKALLGSIGIGEPEIQQINKSIAEPASPNE